MTHELKILPEYYNQVIVGNKNWELRKNDRCFKVGDLIVIREWVEDYTGRLLVGHVKFILENYAGIESGYCILSIEWRL